MEGNRWLIDIDILWLQFTTPAMISNNSPGTMDAMEQPLGSPANSIDTMPVGSPGMGMNGPAYLSLRMQGCYKAITALYESSMIDTIPVSLLEKFQAKAFDSLLFEM
eukprot:TRINITY_DN3650_c0_g2_i1.p1 TRINITY_DN3650_c0_g2~~TRINITY_DN3650_c0_g2_i1.p1  ORF type:complete len:107 (-),score=29.60 TRINITY_DN3650_c0_g2_i1:109-429(-)